uniref:ZXD family zinc finger C n=1 Tax=Sus scrofa TaxID=9823 RepID=A0A4X1U920_PIG
MDVPAVLAPPAPAPAQRGPQLGGGPGRTRRAPGPARRRLLLLRSPEDDAQGQQCGEARPAGPGGGGGGGGGDSFVVLLEVARGAAEAPGRLEPEPEPSVAASPAGRPAQALGGEALVSPTGAPLASPGAAGGQDLVVRLERGVLALAAPPRGSPPDREAACPAEARRAPAGPGYRCPEPQCALLFAKKHQLKVHLLTHSGGQGRRPFKCPLDGCGWAFTTSYKLKRHLQSHDKLRPFGCPVGGCGKKFTTVYNLKAHMKGHEQESLFKCEVCAERFPTHAKLSSHQRSHFEPERPYKCDYPGCEKTFITVSALFSHNRAHFREQELFSCSFPGCSKQYDKACRLKIHLRSHTGERPFICDSDSCGWTFTSMSKLLRHKRKHEDDRRFACPVEGCGKSFTRAEHLKGHSVTHLGTKPFVCPVEDLFPPLGAPSALTPSSDLSGPGQSEFSNVDLALLFSDTPGDNSGAAGASDEALSAGILTIDVTSMSSSLGGDLPTSHTSLGPMDPLVLVAHSDVPPGPDSPLVLGTAATVLQQRSFAMDDTQGVGAGALGCLVAVPVKSLSLDPPALTSGSSSAANTCMPASASSTQGNTSVPELLVPIKVEADSPPGPDTIRQQERSRGAPRPVLSSPAEEHGPQTDAGLGAGTSGLSLEGGGSARTDSRAIQLAKKIKQKGAGSSAGATGPAQTRGKDDDPGSPTCVPASPSGWVWGSLVVPSVQVQLLQVRATQGRGLGRSAAPPRRLPLAVLCPRGLCRTIFSPLPRHHHTRPLAPQLGFMRPGSGFPRVQARALCSVDSPPLLARPWSDGCMCLAARLTPFSALPRRPTSFLMGPRQGL